MSLIDKTIGSCLKERAEKTPGLLGVGYRDFRYTWKELDEISDFLALDYLKQGIKKGCHGAIWGVNSPNWVFTFFALVKIGAVAVLVNTCYKEKELEDVLKDTDVEYLFYGKGCKSVDYEEILSRMSLDRMPVMKRQIPLEKHTQDKWYQRTDFPSRMNREDREMLAAAQARVTCRDTACILFTSGTSNKAKGVMLSHYSLVNNSREIGIRMHWNETDKICISVPLFHCFGVTAGILAGIQAGASLHLLKYYKTIEVLEQIDKYRCTVLNGVPTMFLAILHNEKRRDYDISCIHSGVMAGSPILPSEYRSICRELGIEKLQTSYGQTESSPCITIADYEDPLEIKSVTAGKKIRDVQLRIWNTQANCEAAVNESGEIQTKGYHVMQGYYGLPEKTAQTVDAQGWLHTGDAGYVDSDGYLYVTGRIKEMIIRGGENISPLEIEECIFQMGEAEEVKVIGVPAKVLQEEICACIILKEGIVPDPEKVREFVKSRLSNYKVPRYVLFFQAFPVGQSGKVITKDLKALAGEMIEQKDKEEQECILQNSMN